MGKPVVMGRSTFQSLPGPLRGRTHIVVSRDPGRYNPHRYAERSRHQPDRRSPRELLCAVQAHRLVAALACLPHLGTPYEALPLYDALLAREPGWHASATPGRLVLTPHPGEFERLTGMPPTDDDEQRQQSCAQAARELRQVVVLKGARTVIADPDGALSVAPFENPALASAGTGDVLAGTIGGLFAQGVAAFDAARLGVYLHAVAGERVRDRMGDAGLLASDLPVEIALARRALQALRA